MSATTSSSKGLQATDAREWALNGARVGPERGLSKRCPPRGWGECSGQHASAAGRSCRGPGGREDAGRRCPGPGGSSTRLQTKSVMHERAHARAERPQHGGVGAKKREGCGCPSGYPLEASRGQRLREQQHPLSAQVREPFKCMGTRGAAGEPTRWWPPSCALQPPRAVLRFGQGTTGKAPRALAQSQDRLKGLTMAGEQAEFSLFLFRLSPLSSLSLCLS
jgi:hypothetical protein